jgi:hypothetical protein
MNWSAAGWHAGALNLGEHVGGCGGKSLSRYWGYIDRHCFRIPHKAWKPAAPRPRDGTSTCRRMTYTGSPRSRVSIGR